MTKKMTIVIPQWQGGGQDLCTYDGAYAMLQNYLGGAADEVIGVSTEDIGPVREGILGYDDILACMKRVGQALTSAEPERIFTVGGGCDADTPCAAWLNKVYDGDMAVVINSDEDVHYGLVMKVVTQVQKLGVTKLGFLTMNPKEKPGK